jgi:protein gp37
MAEFSAWLEVHGFAWPANLWALCSVTDERTAAARIPHLLKIGDANTVRGISAEPLLGPVSSSFFPALDWIIAGGMSGGLVDPGSFDRIGALVKEAARFRVPVFLKQFGRDPGRFADKKGGNWAEWDPEFRRREFPRPKGATHLTQSALL